MKPIKAGQVVKFHTPFADEDPDQLYVTLEIKGDDRSARADIKPLHTGSYLGSISTVRTDDLVVVELPTEELIGRDVTIQKEDHSQTSGKVIHVKKSKINLYLDKVATGVKTNVYLTIVDRNGVEIEGTLFVN